MIRRRRAGVFADAAIPERSGRESWRMPPLMLLQRPVMSTGRRIGMAALRLYLAAAMVLVIVKIVRLALGH